MTVNVERRRRRSVINVRRALHTGHFDDKGKPHTKSAGTAITTQILNSGRRTTFRAKCYNLLSPSKIYRSVRKITSKLMTTILRTSSYCAVSCTTVVHNVKRSLHWHVITDTLIVFVTYLLTYRYELFLQMTSPLAG